MFGGTGGKGGGGMGPAITTNRKTGLTEPNLKPKWLRTLTERTTASEPGTDRFAHEAEVIK
jgi:hypothetical protein